MTTVKLGDVYIAEYSEYIKEGPVRVLKSYYFIDKVQNEEICDAVVITFWNNSLPTLHYTTGPVSDILAPPAEGSVRQGTRKDWMQALYRMWDVVENHTRWVYKLNPQEEKE